MSKTKWTPGPWAAKEWSNDESDIVGFSLTARGYLLPMCSYTGTIEEATANARLISSSPELYEALRALLDDVGGTNSMPGAVLARSALAKARGEA